VRWLPGEIDFRRGEREGEYEQMYRFVLLGKRESIWFHTSDSFN
jgi:hypothetical protein